MYKDDAEGCGNETTATVDVDVVALTDVVDMNGDAGIGANTMLLH